MSTFAIIVLLLVLAVLIDAAFLFVGLLLLRRKSRGPNLAVLEDLLRSTLRFEIQLNDWGEEYEDMRWRYTIWDADIVMRAVFHPEIEMMPMFLGNRPTREEAERAALDWVHKEARDISSFTVTHR